MEDSEKLQDLKTKIKVLEQKKTTLTDVAEIKAINKQINAIWPFEKRNPIPKVL